MIKSPEDITSEIIAIHEKVCDLKRKSQMENSSQTPDKAKVKALSDEWQVLENKVITLVIERREAFRLEAVADNKINNGIHEGTKDPLESDDDADDEQTECMTHDEEMDLHDSIESANPSGRDLPDRNEDGEYLNGGGYMP
jgi:hypothetical protein